jgi:flagella synthesis protein FlgN
MALDSIIESLLTQQIENLTALEQILNEEKIILGKHDPDALIAITKQKEALLSKIVEYDQKLVASPQLKPLKQQGEFSQEFAKINQLLASCKDLNEINGKAIAQSQHTINHIRTSIFESQGKSSLTYDEKAKTNTGVSNLNLKA